MDMESKVGSGIQINEVTVETQQLFYDAGTLEECSLNRQW